MIPFLPLETNPMDVPVFYRQIAENLEIRLGHHEAWHTHKRDPSVCPICDCIELSKLVIGEMERFISKSAVELSEQLLSQDISSEGETYNKDEESLLSNGNRTSDSDGDPLRGSVLEEDD